MYKGDGLIIERNSAKSGARDSGIASPMDDDVPNAFNYRTPSKQQLERSGPIPRHIVSIFFNLFLQSSPFYYWNNSIWIDSSSYNFSYNRGSLKKNFIDFKSIW